MKLSIVNLVVICAYEKGYRVIDGKLFNPKGKELKPRINNNGYPGTTIRFNGKSKNLPVHKLAAFQKFGDAVFQDKIEVRHLNDNKLDFSLPNIEIGTHQQNHLDRCAKKEKERILKVSLKLKKFSQQQAEEIRNNYFLSNKRRDFISEKAREYNVCHGTIRNIINKKHYK
jgi:hypothetical protein